MSFGLKVGNQTVRAVSGWSYDEEATPLDGSDPSGSTGDMSVSFAWRDRPAHVARMGTKDVTMLETGQALGTVDGTGVTDKVGSLSLANRAVKLSVVRSAKPWAGTLAGAIAYWCSLAGVTTGITVDSAIAIRPVVVVGWHANVWLQIKLFCAAQQVEVALVGNQIIVRPPRTRYIGIGNAASVALTVDDTQRCQRVQVSYYLQQPLLPGDIVFDYANTNVGGRDPDAQFSSSSGTTAGVAANGDYPTGGGSGTGQVS